MSIPTLPTINGAVPGFWAVEMREPHTTMLGGAPFRCGFSERPMRGRELRHLLAAMGNAVKGAFRCTYQGAHMNEVLGDLSEDAWELEPYQGYVDRDDIAEADSYRVEDHFGMADSEDSEDSDNSDDSDEGSSNEGSDEGSSDGYDEGSDEGSSDGYDEGSSDGYDGYDDMTVPVLRALAKERGVSIAALKKDLVANLRADDVAKAEDDSDAEDSNDSNEGSDDSDEGSSDDSDKDTGAQEEE